MPRIRFYTTLALKDVFRLWSATQLQVIIISGICLPILILLGLKNGHVTQLREELATSPTGRQVIFYSAQAGDMLSEDVLTDIKEEVENAELIIPESQRLVFLSASPEENDKGTTSEVEKEVTDEAELPLTLYSTLPGDPLLAQFGIDSIDDTSLEIVISESLAESVAVTSGDNVSVEIRRQLGSDRESHRLQFKVAGVMPSERAGGGSGVGYAHLNVMKLLERYGSGASIDAWEIPAMPALAAVDLYDSMLLYCFRGTRSELSENDLEFLKGRGLVATEVDDPQLITLYGTLKDCAIDELKVYRLRRMDHRDDELVPVRDNPQMLVRNTEAEDDFIVRWSSPLVLPINDKPFKIVGLTLPTLRETGGWINTFVRDNAMYFGYQQSIDSPLSIKIADPKVVASEDRFELQVDGLNLMLANDAPQPKDTENGNPLADAETERIELGDETDDTIPAIAQEDADLAVASSAVESLAEDTLPIAIVPVNSLALIHQYRFGLVQFDAGGQRFIENPTALDYTKARLYTKTIDDVPAAVDLLASRRFAVLSESSRIAEIQAQGHSLQTLVVVVAVGVFAFGVVTVFSVLVDSTDRKKGTIGILRVMGMTRWGVFQMVLLRALTIGFLAALLCSAVGYAIAQFLSANFVDDTAFFWKPVISVILAPEDIMLVALGALLCAAFGAVMPAVKASALDPFDAIMEGQFG